MMRQATAARLGLMVTALVASAACATTPTGPSLLVLPGEGRSHDQFRADDARCRAAGAAELPATAGGYVSAQTRYDMVYVQCMYAAGHQVPVRGGPLGSRDREPAPPAPPTGAPPPPPPGGATPAPPTR